MRKTEFVWNSSDGNEIYSQVWSGDSFREKAVVCLIHGLGEHSGRYEHVAEHVTAHGYAMLAFDLPGHGKSTGLQGHAASEELFLQNVEHAINEARLRFPNRPVFLYGHSLGALIAVLYVLKRHPSLAGVIVTGLALRSSLEEQKIKIFEARCLAIAAPRMQLSTGLHIEDISRDPKVQQAYAEDPLVHNRTTPAMAVAILDMIPQIFERAAEFDLPILIMHGTADRLAYLSGSQEFADLTTCDCTFKLWDGLSHELHNEPEKEAVLNTITDWLDSISGLPLDKLDRPWENSAGESLVLRGDRNG